MSQRLQLDAPAKLNLSLAVTGRRADGLHELASTFALLELADRLVLRPGLPGLEVRVADGEDVPADPARNLAWRGLLAGLGGEPSERLVLEKRIPAAAGLGGGSSDAAGGWRLGRRRRGLDERPDDAVLQELARIGADVPFFAAQLPAAEVRGIGERVVASGTRSAHVVLVLPPFRLSTAAVFAELRERDWTRVPQPGHNDLLAPARRLRPELDDIRRLVLTAGAEAHLTGSGSTLYVLLDDAERASALAGRLARAGLRALRTRLAQRAASIATINEEESETE
ncbi:MAG TPA: 4-(cytidine 5'-diphospho)-2-C-methyl-D-erythritol kinase [Candidatus Limnocylindria bacterium]|nr:4-(cytidine 5'-diphospho)-2-C-methyl-D-erythritol kinase [Candidatus Limnocylindria bacterium]